MALVNSGNTTGSLNIPKHAMGPFLLYTVKNLCTELPSSGYVSAIRINTSGLNKPCAVWNEGSVSLGDKTEEDMNGRDVDVFLGEVVVEEPRPRFVSSRTRR